MTYSLASADRRCLHPQALLFSAVRAKEVDKTIRYLEVATRNTPYFYVKNILYKGFATALLIFTRRHRLFQKEKNWRSIHTPK
ncbi:MAG TPA: hypothetical protein DEF45_17480 [Rhodopirellula sp.]|nr:hypothetical protein [Rhodopirellula sp.]